MWKEIKNTNYYLSFDETSDYVIHVTDYLRIWYTRLSRNTLIQCLKESNVLLQMQDNVMLQKAFDILSNPSEIKSACVAVENNVLNLTLTKQYGYNFKIILPLTEGSKELFFQKITQPVLKTIHELQAGQAELCELLVKKDKEIKKLRDTGQTHSHEQTSLFKTDVFLATHSKVKNYFGSDHIPMPILDKTVIPPEDMKIIKQENDDITSIDEIKQETKIELNTNIKNEIENIPTFNYNEIEAIKEETHQAVKREIPTSSPSKRKKFKLNL